LTSWGGKDDLEFFSMKELLLGLMLLMTATAASAEWTQSAGNDEVVIYVDRATIRRTGNFVKMWDLTDFNAVQTVAGDSYFSSKALSEYDCKEEKTRLIVFSWFSGKMGGGKGVFSDSDPSNWRPVSPRSLDEIQWKIACGKK